MKRREIKFNSLVLFLVLLLFLFSTNAFIFQNLGMKAYAASSAHYQINADSINFMGGDSSSAHYQLNDTGGEIATGDSSSAHYNMRAGYWPMVIDYHISISAPLDVTMGGIISTGQSDLTNNYATWNIKTDNPAGYSLTWRADSATMNSGGDTIAAYTPAVPNTPETWSIAAADSEWGGHLGSGSTTVDLATWGAADTYAGGKWLNVAIIDFQIASRATRTSAPGDDETIYFGAEVGASKFQPTGNYSVHVTVTATTL